MKVSSHVTCTQRNGADNRGKTCRQRWRGSFEHWCAACCLRYDLDHRAHEVRDPESLRDELAEIRSRETKS